VHEVIDRVTRNLAVSATSKEELRGVFGSAGFGDKAEEFSLLPQLTPPCHNRPRASVVKSHQTIDADAAEMILLRTPDAGCVAASDRLVR
jgi:hypothetical protein